MGVASILKYVVELQYSRGNAPNRWIHLQTDPTVNPPPGVAKFLLVFDDATHSSLGSFNSAWGGRVTVYLPLPDFERIRVVLQTEKPVYVYWDVAADNQLKYFVFGTTAEPLGEGLVDQG